MLSKTILVALFALISALQVQGSPQRHVRDVWPPPGQRLYGDICEYSSQCTFPEGVCGANKMCECPAELPVTNYLDRCGRAAKFGEMCTFKEQCGTDDENKRCKDGKCTCKPTLYPVVTADGRIICQSNVPAPVSVATPVSVPSTSGADSVKTAISTLFVGIALKLLTNLILH